MDSDSDVDAAFKTERRNTRKFRYAIVESILQDVFTSAVEISNRTSWKCKHHPCKIRNFYLSRQLRSEGNKILCLNTSPDGKIAILGLLTGLLILDVNSREMIFQWENIKKTGVYSIGVINVGLEDCFLLLTLDELGVARLFVHKNDFITLVEEMNEVGSGMVVYTDFTFCEKKSVVIFKCKKENNQFLEIHSLMIEKWVLSIQNDNFNTNFATTLILAIIQEPTIDLICPLFSSNLLQSQSLLLRYKKGYCAKSPSFVIFNPCPKFCPDSNLNEVLGLAVWWSGDNNLYLYAIVLNNNISTVDSNLKPATTWHHSDRISKCVVNNGSTLVAVALENGTISVKQISTGSIKHLVRLCSIGKIKGVWFAQNWKELESRDITKESILTKTPTSISNVTSESTEGKKRAESSAETATYSSGISVVGIYPSVITGSEDEEAEDEFTPTPTLEDEKKNEFDMMQEKVDDLAKNFTCHEGSSDYLITSKIGSAQADYGYTYGCEKDYDFNVCGSVAPSSSVSNDSLGYYNPDAKESTTDSKKTTIEQNLSSKVGEESSTAKLMRKFQSEFTRTSQSVDTEESDSLLVALCDGSLWQLKWNCKQTLRHLIAVTNDNDEIVSLVPIACKPHLVMCFTKQGRVYLVDHVCEENALVKEVCLPAGYVIYNASRAINCVFNGKMLFIAGCENVNARQVKYLSGELFSIDLFPDLDEKKAASIAQTVREQRCLLKSELSVASLIKFRPSVNFDIESQVVLKEIHEKFLNWCKDNLKQKTNSDTEK